MEHRGRSIYDLLHPLAVAVIRVTRCRCAVVYLNQPLVLIVDILAGTLGCGVSVIVIPIGITVRAG